MDSYIISSSSNIQIPKEANIINIDNGLNIGALENEFYYIDKSLTPAQKKSILEHLGLFANITYTAESDPFEHYFQSVIYLVFTLLGKYVECERHTYSGRIDCKVETAEYIYLFEFKRDDTAKAALAQINTGDYALPFVADSRKLYKIGVSFDSDSRKLVEWELEE